MPSQGLDQPQVQVFSRPSRSLFATSGHSAGLIGMVSCWGLSSSLPQPAELTQGATGLRLSMFARYSRIERPSLSSYFCGNLFKLLVACNPMDGRSGMLERYEPSRPKCPSAHCEYLKLPKTSASKLKNRSTWPEKS